jgi:hypothetical protein
MSLIVTLLFLLAGLLVMISGALPKPMNEHLRRYAGRLALSGIGVLLLAVVVSAIPARYVVAILVIASIGAYFTIEHRRRTQRPHIQHFMNFRTGGKRLVDDDELPRHPRRDEYP